MSLVIWRRGLTEGWVGLLVASLSVAAMLVLGLWAYESIDLSIYESLPDAARALMGVPVDADPALLAYSEMLASVGSLAFVGVAIAIGARGVAGEEERRTLHLVLSTPLSRLRFAVSKVASFVSLVVLGSLVLWVLAELTPVVLGVEAGQAHVGALMLHLGAAALCHGSLAFAIGAATGRRGQAAAIAALVMVLGWFGAGLLPMWREHAADWIPWTWLNGSKPLVNGVDWGDLGLLVGLSVVALVVGIAVFTRRELRLAQSGSNWAARLRSNPKIAKLTTPAGASSILGLRLGAGRTLLVVVIYVLGLAMGVLMPFVYKGMHSALEGLADNFPTSMLLMFGGGDELISPAGFMQVETFGMMAPLAVILVGVAAGASGIAGEEQSRHLAVLLSLPISRARVYFTVAAAVALQVVIVAGSLFVGVWLGCLLAGVELSIANLAWACVLLALLGLFFGLLALLLSAATGRTSVAVWVPTFLAVATYFGYTLLNAVGKAGLAWWSPFSPYLSGPPLMAGIEWWQPVWLGVASLVALVVGLPLFRSRDLRR